MLLRLWFESKLLGKIGVTFSELKELFLHFRTSANLDLRNHCRAINCQLLALVLLQSVYNGKLELLGNIIAFTIVVTIVQIILNTPYRLINYYLGVGGCCSDRSPFTRLEMAWHIAWIGYQISSRLCRKVNSVDYVISIFSFTACALIILTRLNNKLLYLFKMVQCPTPWKSVSLFFVI